MIDIDALHQNLLIDLAQAPQRLESAINGALHDHDFDALRRVISAIADVPSPLVQHWRAYAEALVALEGERNAAAAIDWLERLRVEPDLDVTLRGKVLNSLGIAYEMSERWDKALQCYQDGLALHEAKGKRLGAAVVSLNLAILQRKATDYSAAKINLNRSIGLSEAEEPSPHRQITLAAALNELGYVALEEGNAISARAPFQRAYDLWAEQGDVWGQGIACDNLADAAKACGDAAEAERLYRQGRELSVQAGNAYQVAQATYSLARLKLDTQAAVVEISVLLDEASALADTSNNLDITADIHLSRAKLHDRQGHVAEALDESRRAVAVVESLRANITQPDDRARMTAARIKAYEAVVMRLLQSNIAPSASNIDEAFRMVEMSKSRALAEMLANQPIRRPEQVPQTLWDDEAQLRRMLENLYGDAQTNAPEIQQRESQLAQVRERIRLLDANCDSLQTAQPVALDDVRSRLPDDAALIEYFSTGDDLHAFIVAQRDVRVVTLPLKLAQLTRSFGTVGDKRLGPLRGLTPDANGRLQQPWILEKLHAALIAPLGETVRAAQTLCVVPHGLLHYVPFAALHQPSSKGPRYLNSIGDDNQVRAIVCAPSATVQFAYCDRKAQSSQAGCLAFGFDGARLAHAEREAATIAQVTGGTMRVGQAATRAELIAQAATFRQIHIACHGRFNPAWPAASSLALADGLLDVTDIFRDLRLDADLVSLSACETGRSHVLRGDELTGMARAFLYAGAASVAVSHWVVDDVSTGLFFAQFYTALAARTQNSRALADAQHFLRQLSANDMRDILTAQGMRRDEIDGYLAQVSRMTSADERPFAHPYFWAPFFVMGDHIGRGP